MKRILLVLLFVSLLISRSYSNESGEHLTKDNYREIITSYKKSIRSNEESIKNYNELAISLFKKGEIKQSTKLYEKVVQLYLEVADNYMRLGDVSYQISDLEKAIEFYQKVVQFDPNRSDVYYKLGITYEGIGYANRATKYYKEAFQRKSVCLGIEDSLESDENKLNLVYDQTIEGFQNLYENNIQGTSVHQAKVYYELGRGYEEDGHYDKAITYFKRSLYFKPNYIKPYISLGTFYNRKGDYIKAKEYFQKSLEFYPNLDAFINLGKLYSREGDYEKAIKYFEKAIETTSYNIVTHFHLGKAYGSNNDWGNAWSQVTKLRELDRNDLADELEEILIEIH